MRRSTLILGALLALSVVFLLRRRADPPPAATFRAASPRAEAALAAEVRKVEALEARLRELEADQRFLLEAAVPAEPGGLRRERLRRLLSPLEVGGYRDPRVELERSELDLELYRAFLNRDRNPRAYVETMREFCELALEQPPLPEALNARLKAIFDELGTAFEGVRADSAGERLLRQLELEEAALARLRRELGPEHAARLSGNGWLHMTAGYMGLGYFQETGGEDAIVDTWTGLYGLDPTRAEEARPIAQALVQELRRQVPAPGQDPRFLRVQPGTPEYYRARRDALGAQLAALRQIQSAWTPEQRDRVREREPRTFIYLPSPSAIPFEEDENP